MENYLRYDLVGTEPTLRSGGEQGVGVRETARCPQEEQTIARWQREVPALVTRTVPDVDHFTITLIERGARAIAEALRELRER